MASIKETSAKIGCFGAMAVGLLAGGGVAGFYFNEVLQGFRGTGKVETGNTIKQGEQKIEGIRIKLDGWRLFINKEDLKKATNGEHGYRIKISLLNNQGDPNLPNFDSNTNLGAYKDIPKDLRIFVKGTGVIESMEEIGAIPKPSPGYSAGGDFAESDGSTIQINLSPKNPYDANYALYIEKSNNLEEKPDGTSLLDRTYYPIEFSKYEYDGKTEDSSILSEFSLSKDLLKFIKEDSSKLIAINKIFIRRAPTFDVIVNDREMTLSIPEKYTKDDLNKFLPVIETEIVSAQFYMNRDIDTFKKVCQELAKIESISGQYSKDQYITFKLNPDSRVGRLLNISDYTGKSNPVERIRENYIESEKHVYATLLIMAFRFPDEFKSRYQQLTESEKKILEPMMQKVQRALKSL
jgi:hypothetical protein